MTFFIHRGEPTPLQVGTATRILRAVAIVACGPYLAIKVAWVSGSHIGIPAGSSLLDHRTAMILGNLASVLLDSAVVMLALLLTQQWGRRVSAWLLIVPVWVATGLLSPIVLGYPLQLVARLFGGGSAPTSGGSTRPFLDEWVFTAVYTGFIVQALALGALFVSYARSRWGHLWRGLLSATAGQGATGHAQRATAVAAAAALLAPFALHVAWASGATIGLTSSRVADRTSDFYALEAAYAVLAMLAIVGLLMIAFPGSSRLPLQLPLSLAFIGPAALACWGAYLMLSGLGNADASKSLSELTDLAYSLQIVAGALVFAMGTYFFAERAARAGHAPRRAADRHPIECASWNAPS